MAFVSSFPISTSTTSSKACSSSKTHLRTNEFVMTPTNLRAKFLHKSYYSSSFYNTIKMQDTDIEMENDGEVPTEHSEPSEPPMDRVPEDAKLFVGNLSWGTTDSSLGAAFESYGTVIDARVITDKFTGKSRGFGFIEFDNGTSAKNALSGMDGVEIDGRAVRVDRANRRSGPPQRQQRY